jgi:hypothetical protein
MFHQPRDSSEEAVEESEGESDIEETRWELFLRSRSAAALQRERERSSMDEGEDAFHGNEDEFGGSDKENAPPPGVQYDGECFQSGDEYNEVDQGDSDKENVENCPDYRCPDDAYAHDAPGFSFRDIYDISYSMGPFTVPNPIKVRSRSFDCPCHYEHEVTPGEPCSLVSPTTSKGVAQEEDMSGSMSDYGYEEGQPEWENEGYEAEDEGLEWENETDQPESDDDHWGATHDEQHESDDDVKSEGEGATHNEPRFMLSAARYMARRRAQKSTGLKVRRGSLEEVELSSSH